MAKFQDLPQELLPEVFEHVYKPSHLARLCLVSRLFNTYAISRLYATILVYAWHKEVKSKVIKLFETLSNSPYLGSLVKRLDIRDFPKSTASTSTQALIIQGLRHCQNLTACSWTRDGSLSPELLETLSSSCPNLRELEVNGHHGQYDPRLLLDFQGLRKITLIMPSIGVVSQLGAWFDVAGGSLGSLTLICRASSLVTDGLLTSLAPSLFNLHTLQLAGCPKVTHYGVWSIIAENQRQDGLRTLSLEGLSPRFDLPSFAERCTSSPSLAQLASLTLSIPHHPQSKSLTYLQTWLEATVLLTSLSPLEKMQLYSSSSANLNPGSDPELSSLIVEETNRFWERLTGQHRETLKRISVHRMAPLRMEVIAEMCRVCERLEELFVVIDSRHLGRSTNGLDELGHALSLSKTLRTVHVNLAIQSASDMQTGTHHEQDSLESEYDQNRSSRDVAAAGPAALSYLDINQSTKIVNACPETISQFGCNTRVWSIEKRVAQRQDGELTIERCLVPYEYPEVPEQFLVVRT